MSVDTDIAPETPVLEPRSEIDRIDPIPDQVTLESGTVVQILPLRSRQFFKLLRIITRGGANLLGSVRLSTSLPQEEFVGNLLALVMFAIPEAEDETLSFVRSMVAPVGVDVTDKKALAFSINLLDEELDNPEIIDLVNIVAAIVQRESQDLQSLGKRLQSMLKIAEKTGQVTPETTSSAASPEPSI
jgi:hypothetical protein